MFGVRCSVFDVRCSMFKNSKFKLPLCAMNAIPKTISNKYAISTFIFLVKILSVLFILNVIGHALAFYIQSGTFRIPAMIGFAFCKASTFSPTYPFYDSPVFLSALIKTSLLYLLYQFGTAKEKKKAALISFIFITVFVFFNFCVLYHVKFPAIFGVKFPAIFHSFSYEYTFSKHHFGNIFLFPAGQILAYTLFYFYESKNTFVEQHRVVT